MIKLRTHKTKTLIEIPVLPPLRTYLNDAIAKSENEYVFPELAAWYKRDPSSISFYFCKYLAKSGIINVRKPDQTRKYKVNRKGIHSLRHTFVPKKGKNGLSATVKGHAGWTVVYQTVGPWHMIVVRDAQRRAVDCLLRVEQHYFMDRPDVQTLSMHDLFDGVYEGPEGKKAVFGPRLSHYENIDYSKDPGIFSVVPDKQFNVTGHIMYGDNRVSRGDPSSPKFGKMPGGGGAAAIMGPMEWEVSPILGGLHVKVVKDEPFVLHSPGFGVKEFDLQRIASPYPDLPGIYAVASVRPLPLGLLRMLPKGDLQRMNSEIAERHTDRHDLSDIEQLNLELIKAALTAD